MFSLRNADIKDCDLYYEWANDPAVRSASFNQEKTPYENHCKWFKAKIKDVKCKMFLFMYNGVPAGQIRIVLEDEKAIINYSVAKEYRGKGFGSVMIEKAEKRIAEHGVSLFYAEVKP